MMNHHTISFKLFQNSFVRQMSTRAAQPKSRPIAFNMENDQRKKVIKRLDKVNEWMKDQNHIYKTSINWESADQISKLLIDSEIFHSDKMIVFNKPSGLAATEPKDTPSEISKSVIMMRYQCGSSIRTKFSIEGCLPQLREHYNCPELMLTCAPDRWMSGVAILSKENGFKEAIRKIHRMHKANREPYKSIIVISSGKVMDQDDIIQVGVDKTDPNTPILTKKVGRNKMKRGQITTTWISHKTLEYSKKYDMSLVRINLINFTNNMLRLYMTSMASPILGDNIFGHRVREVLGRRVKVNPYKLVYSPPTVAAPVMKALQLGRGNMEAIPLQAHLYQHRLREAYAIPEMLTAPFPPQFKWTMSKLGFSYFRGTSTQKDKDVLREIYGCEDDLDLEIDPEE